MTLRAIEQINGGPFVLSGFDWDYGGTVIHCGGGSFEELGSRRRKGFGAHASPAALARSVSAEQS